LASIPKKEQKYLPGFALVSKKWSDKKTEANFLTNHRAILLDRVPLFIFELTHF
jgi:hypothetical protein